MRLRTAAFLSLLALVTAGCDDPAVPPGASLVTFGAPNPNRLPPGWYTQSPLAIPTTINDTWYFATSPFTSAWPGYLWSYDDLKVSPLYSSLTLPPREIVVAVIDTGVDKDHEDLAGRLWLNPVEGTLENYDNHVDDDGDGFVDDFIGWDFIHGTNNPADDAGHGTHVAGTIAAIGGNARGIVGVAPWVRIMALKVCDSTGACLTSDVRAALAYAVAHGARIVNLSLGLQDSGVEADAFDEAIREATDAGTLVFAAAGNSSADASLFTPANATDAVAVAAYRSDGAICGFSNFGWKVDVSAPGCALKNGAEAAGILSLNSKKCGPLGNRYCSTNTVSDPDYALKAGTSMATTHAAGLAAVAWTASPDATPLQIRQALLRTARARGAAGTRGTLDGAGMISGVNLIDEARTAPGIKIVSPRYGTTATSQTISAKIEARDQPVTWSLRYVASPTGNVDVSTGVAFGTGGSVSAQTTATVTEHFAAPGAGSYLVILEANAGGRSYYDVTLLNAP
jgi:hypothetical protein